VAIKPLLSIAIREALEHRSFHPRNGALDLL
jgi:hypothetical protein